MSVRLRLALVGDYRPEAVAHQAIPGAVKLAAEACGLMVAAEWLPTESIVSPAVLQKFDAVQTADKPEAMEGLWLEQSITGHGRSVLSCHGWRFLRLCGRHRPS